MDPLAGYGAWAAGRAQSAQGSENDDEVPSAAILLLLLGVPALLIIAALVAIVLA